MLRTIGLGGGLLLIWQPVLHSSRIQNEKALLATLVDRSASMNLKQGGIDREEQLRGLLNSGAMRRLNERTEFNLYSFSDSLRIYEAQGDKPPPAVGSLTDIGLALSGVLSAFNQRQVDGVLLITDGANNHGADPVRIAQTGHKQI